MDGKTEIPITFVDDEAPRSDALRPAAAEEAGEPTIDSILERLGGASVDATSTISVENDSPEPSQSGEDAAEPQPAQDQTSAGMLAEERKTVREQMDAQANPAQDRASVERATAEAASGVAVDAQAGTEAESNADAKPETGLKAATVAKAETTGEAGTAARVKTNTESEPDAKTNTAAKTAADAKAESGVKAEKRGPEEKASSGRAEAKAEPDEKQPKGNGGVNGHSASGQRRHEDIGLALAQNDALEEALIQIERLRAERSSLYDQLLRRQAEFENFRKRIEREKTDSNYRLRGEVLLELLPIMDSFDRALASRDGASRDRASNDGDSVRTGLELIHRQLKDALTRMGLQHIETLGAMFDPNVHEAITVEPTAEFVENTILQEFERGYMLGDRLLRPAKVKVAGPVSI